MTAAPVCLFAGLYSVALAVLFTHHHRADAYRTLEYSIMFVGLAIMTRAATPNEPVTPKRGKRFALQLTAISLSIFVTVVLHAYLDGRGGPLWARVASKYGVWQFAIEACVTFAVLRLCKLSAADLLVRTWAHRSRIAAVWILTAIGFLTYDVATGTIGAGEAIRDVSRNVFANGASEEFLFRGALLSRIRLTIGDRWALLVQALVFGIWHFPTDLRVANGDVLVASCLVVTVQAVFGYALGYLALRTNTIAIGAAFHAVADATSII